MPATNADILEAVSSALTNEFKKRFLKDDFSTTDDDFKGRPKRMHGRLSNLKMPDGTVNMQAVVRMTRRAVNALSQIKGKRRLRFYPAKAALAPASAESATNITVVPPARIAVQQDRIGFLFQIKAYA